MDAKAPTTGEPRPERPAGPDDPLELAIGFGPGDSEHMMDCLVEEYARLGWGIDQIEAIFVKPFFRATYGLGQSLGQAELRERIRQVLERCGVLRFQVSLERTEDGDGPGV